MICQNSILQKENNKCKPRQLRYPIRCAVIGSVWAGPLSLLPLDQSCLVVRKWWEDSEISLKTEWECGDSGDSNGDKWDKQPYMILVTENASHSPNLCYVAMVKSHGPCVPPWYRESLYWPLLQPSATHLWWYNYITIPQNNQIWTQYIQLSTSNGIAPLFSRAIGDGYLTAWDQVFTSSNSKWVCRGARGEKIGNE